MARPTPFSAELQIALNRMQEINSRPKAHDPVVIRQDGMMRMVGIENPLHPEYRPPRAPGLLQRLKTWWMSQ